MHLFQVTGSKAPQLKRLGQWLIENPMFDVDPKWAELVKERGNLPHDLQKRLSGNDRSNVNKGKSPGRPPMMPSPTSQQSANQANLVATSMASGLNFPSLSNLNTSLLSGLSLGNFDPKNNPLLMPFGGLPNLGALSGLGNLSNLSNMSLTNSLFANLAGLGLPTLAGMEAALGATAATSTAADTNPVVSSVSSKNTGSTGISSTGKSRSKLEPPTSKSSVPSTSSASSTIPTTTPFPFFFPNPSLLYTPLGLGGLNPFSMQPGGVSSAYESLAQCGLLNPPTSSASTVRKPASSGNNSRRDTITDSTPKRKDTEKKSRYSIDPGIALQQYTDMTALHSEDKRRVEHDKRESMEQNDVADLSDRRAEKKNKEQEMKEALEHLSRTSAELLTRNFEDIQRSSEKRGRTTDYNQSSDQQPSSMLEVTLEPVNKKPRIEIEVTTKPVTTTPITTITPVDVSAVEIEYGSRSSSVTIKPSPIEENNTITITETSPSTKKRESIEITPSVTTTMPPTTVTPTTTITPIPTPTPARTPTPTPAHTPTSISTPLSTPTPTPTSTPTPTPTSLLTSTSVTPVTTIPDETVTSQQSTSNAKGDSSKATSEVEEDNKGTKGKKARSGKRLNVEPPPERKNLRSSAGRQARAAAERQARMEGELQADQQQETHTTSE